MRVIVECYADEALVAALGIPRNLIEHSLGRGNVCRQLSKAENSLAMVDEDPGAARPGYLSRMQMVDTENAVGLFKDPKTNNQIVTLSPRLEEWLVQAAKEAKVKLSDYGFSNDQGSGLHEEINGRLKKFPELTEALVAAGSKRMLRLQSILLARK